MLKVGVLGAGHLGKIHLRLLQQSEKYELVGFYDENQENGAKVAQEFGYKQFSTIATLIHAVDVIDIVTPTLSHYKCAKVSIKSGKHVFIEKPISNTVAEAEEIIALSKEYNVKGQVGHVERFNPAFKTTKDSIINTMLDKIGWLQRIIQNQRKARIRRNSVLSFKNVGKIKMGIFLQPALVGLAGFLLAL